MRQAIKDILDEVAAVIDRIGCVDIDDLAHELQDLAAEQERPADLPVGKMRDNFLNGAAASILAAEHFDRIMADIAGDADDQVGHIKTVASQHTKGATNERPKLDS